MRGIGGSTNYFIVAHAIGGTNDRRIVYDAAVTGEEGRTVVIVEGRLGAARCTLAPAVGWLETRVFQW